MTRIVGIHEFEPKPGVTEAELEQAAKKLIETPNHPGWKVSLIKSDRGTDVGRYGLLMEIDSIEARNRIFDGNGETEESTQFAADHPEMDVARDHLTSLIVQPVRWNDFLVLE
jgi:hypothetical protein